MISLARNQKNITIFFINFQLEILQLCNVNFVLNFLFVEKYFLVEFEENNCWSYFGVLWDLHQVFIQVIEFPELSIYFINSNVMAANQRHDVRYFCFSSINDNFSWDFINLKPATLYYPLLARPPKIVQIFLHFSPQMKIFFNFFAILHEHLMEKNFRILKWIRIPILLYIAKFIK